MGIVALLVAVAACTAGVLALVGARGVLRFAAVVTLCLNLVALATLVVVAMLDRANTARKANPAGPHPAFDAWSDVWQSMALWSLLDLLACVVFGLALVVVSVAALADAAARDTAFGRRGAQGGRLARHAAWLGPAHAALTVAQGVATFVWIAPYVPSP